MSQIISFFTWLVTPTKTEPKADPKAPPEPTPVFDALEKKLVEQQGIDTRTPRTAEERRKLYERLYGGKG